MKNCIFKTLESSKNKFYSYPFLTFAGNYVHPIFYNWEFFPKKEQLALARLYENFVRPSGQKGIARG